MSEYITDSRDLKSLIEPEYPPEIIWQEREQELYEASAEANELLTCYFCNQSIGSDESINLHHPIYKSRGGTEVVPSHEQCHRAHHSEDFREWGKLSSLTRAWAFNLKNVRNHPAYAFDRAYYSMLYTH
jgi:hypothetical protein